MVLLVSRSSCSPNEITGMADAKNMYVVGAKILHLKTTQFLGIRERGKGKERKEHASIITWNQRKIHYSNPPCRILTFLLCPSLSHRRVHDDLLCSSYEDTFLSHIPLQSLYTPVPLYTHTHTHTSQRFQTCAYLSCCRVIGWLIMAYILILLLNKCFVRIDGLWLCISSVHETLHYVMMTVRATHTYLYNRMLKQGRMNGCQKSSYRRNRGLVM